MKKFLSLIIILSLVSLLAACGSTKPASTEQPTGNGKSNETTNSGETIKLSYAFFAPENTFPAVQMKKWKDELEARTNGKVSVDLFFGGTLLSAENMYDGVEKKIADIGLSCPTYEPGRFPLIGISDMPSGYLNSLVASQTVNELIREFNPKAFQNFKIITAFATEPAFIQSKDPVSNLEDIKGMQLRISGSLTPVMETLGASPVGMSMAETPQAIQTGVVSGQVSSREVLKDLQLADMVHNVTDYPLSITSFVAVMNLDKWNSLPEDVQKVIEDLRDEMSQFAGQYLDDHVTEAMKWSIEEKGLKVIKLTDEEQQKWNEKLSPLQDEYVQKINDQGLPGTEYKEKLYELIEKFEK